MHTHIYNKTHINNLSQNALNNTTHEQIYIYIYMYILRETMNYYEQTNKM